MSAKKHKKFRKEVRKQVNKNVGIGMEALSGLVRKRPHWIPKRVWMIVYIPLFKKKYRSVIYKYID